MEKGLCDTLDMCKTNKICANALCAKRRNAQKQADFTYEKIFFQLK